MKKANVLKALVAVATIFVGLTFTQCNSVDSKLKEIAKEMNNMCPLEMGGGIRMDVVTAESGKKLNITMTVIPLDAGSQEAKAFESMVKSIMSQSVKANNTKEYQNIKDMGVTFIFTFYDRNKELISKTELSPEDYS